MIGTWVARLLLWCGNAVAFLNGWELVGSVTMLDLIVCVMVVGVVFKFLIAKASG